MTDSKPDDSGRRDSERGDSERIVVYRTSSCPFCVAAEDLLRDKGVQFQQVYLDDHADRRSFTAAIMPGHRTVPLVIIDDQPIGGLTELQAFEESGQLDALAS